MAPDTLRTAVTIPTAPPPAFQVDLRLVAVGEITESFLVPSYQRGYRWGEEEVRLLLDDIAAIKDKDYCLQPIVVKKLVDGRYELIDGQQRLTTLYLIFLYMQKEGFKKSAPPFSIAYATRPQSAEFLRELDPTRTNDNIDFFHLSGAFRCIQEWFAQKKHLAELVAGEMYAHLFRRAKVIWYEAISDINSAALFARLNVGRIPLTNAELVKALLLGRSHEAGAPIPIDRRQIEIGTQWDTIERELHDDRFWAFLTNRSARSYPTRIQLLFELMVARVTSPDRFHTFLHFKEELERGRSPEQVWGDVLARYALLKEWFEDHDLYHSIGYLIATGSEHDGDLRALIQDSDGLTKSDFQAGLDAKIIRRLDLDHNDIDELEYDHDSQTCSRTLLLFNVESTRRLGESFERYPYHSHKASQWSLEHIHAQHAEELNKKEQWVEWLREHGKALRELRVPDSDLAARDGLVADINAAIGDVTKESFTVLSVRVISMFSSVSASDDLHGIENLALLPSGANAALGNAVFEVKRRRILEMDRRGDYIPICTRRVFLKYYTEAGDQQFQFWSKQDREAYLAAMFSEATGILHRYLKPASPAAPEN